MIRMNDTLTDTVPTPLGQSLSDLIVDHSEFFSTLSHELRSPLAAIKGFSQTLVVHWHDLPEERKLDYLEHVLRATTRLERLVGDISLSARLVDGVDLAPASLPLAEIMDQALIEARSLYPQRVFLLEAPAEEVRALADRERLLQVLVNLLENAAKYSPVAAPIALAWQAEGSMARAEIRDSGLSLSQAEQATLFRRYGRLPSNSHAGGNQSGSGLGLYICKGLIEAMHGSIGTAAGPEGQGNVFWFTVPLAG
jgi:signal transduction histidine kinase